jgi:hypothetical protein
LEDDLAKERKSREISIEDDLERQKQEKLQSYEDRLREASKGKEFDKVLGDFQ